MKIAIDLLWLRPKEVGGTEYYVRNLLDGLKQLPDVFSFTLLVSLDNEVTFRHYAGDDRFKLLIADVYSRNIAKRIIWQNLNQNKFLKKHGFSRCFVPVYCKPWFNGEIEYICVIHDLLACHYPKNHPLHEVVYSRVCWQMDAWNAKKILTISNWVKSDIEKRYKRRDIQTIYNPIQINKEEIVDFDNLKRKFNIEKGRFFYTVTQMIPHKNIDTLISVMDKIKREKLSLPNKLLISGVNGNACNGLIRMIEKLGLREHVIITGVVSNEERNTLYQYCAAFLFPSIFEGFGMPPVEAMFFGSRVITTTCTSIPEVTQNKANYVKDPYDVDEWIRLMGASENHSTEMDFSAYGIERIAKEYLKAVTD